MIIYKIDSKTKKKYRITVPDWEYPVPVGVGMDLNINSVSGSSASDSVITYEDGNLYFVGSNKVYTDNQISSFGGIINESGSTWKTVYGHNVPSLTKLYCNDNQITSIDLSGSINLTTLNCGNNPGLTYLDLSSNPNVNILTIAGSSLETLNISNHTTNISNLINNTASVPSFKTLIARNITSSGISTTLNCYGNNLTFLDISGSTRFTTLSCYNNKLTYLNTNGATSLLTINCYNNKLSTLNAVSRPSLTGINCSNNIITFLNISGSTNLSSLNCSNNQLTTLITSGSTKLATINCSYNNITSLDFSKNITASNINCSNNQLTTLITSGSTKLATIDCSYNPLSQSLNMKFNRLLTSISCSNAGLTGLWISSSATGKKLYCPDNQLTALNITESTGNWSFINCRNNLLSSSSIDDLVTYLCYRGIYSGKFDFGGTGNEAPSSSSFISASLLYPESSRVFIFNTSSITPLDNHLLADIGGSAPVETDIENPIGSIDTTDSVNFPYYGFYTYLSVINCPNVTDLLCDNNQINYLNISGSTSITYLNCRYNALSSIDISTNIELNMLVCHDNLLTSLDTDHNPLLTELHCYNNPLTSLNISNNTSLTTLDCNNNYLTSLDLSNNINLTHVWAYGNQLTSLDLSNNANLLYLILYDNLLSELDVNNILIALDTNGLIAGSVDLTGGANAVPTGDGIIAKNSLISKEWNIYTNLQHIDNHLLAANTFALPYNYDITNPSGAYHITGGYSWISAVNCPNLFSLQCDSTACRYLNISGSTTLNSLYCSVNELIALDLNTNISLYELTCYNNKLITLDCSKNTNLTLINCADNPRLTTLNISNTKISGLATAFLTMYSCTKLATLSASNCNPNLSAFPGSISALNWVTSSLKYIDLSNNAITTANVNAILTTLANANLISGSINLIGGTNAIPTDSGNVATASLKSRGWTVLTN